MKLVISTCINYTYTNKCQTGRTECIYLVVAVRKVAACHKLIDDGHKTVAEGWRLFEEAVDEWIPGDLPQLLQQLKKKTTPMPPPSPMDLDQATQQSPVPSPVKREGE